MATLKSPRLQNYFDEYSENHQSKGNELTHYFGITFIVISLLGLFGNLLIGVHEIAGFELRLDGGVILLALGSLWYLYLDWKIAIPFSFVLFGLYFFGRALPVQVDWGLFIFGWILQFIGHAVFEKKSPAFFRNIIHLLVGPIWIFARLIRY